MISNLFIINDNSIILYGLSVIYFSDALPFSTPAVIGRCLFFCGRVAADEV